jgi:hypothetical protein
MDQNGARVYNSIYKRTWRAMRDEFRVQAHLNQLFFTADKNYEMLTRGPDAMVQPDDYSAYGLSVRPAADPHIVSDTQRIDQADKVVGMATQLPGFNRYQSILRALKARNIPNIEEIFPPPMTQGPDGKPVPSKDFPPPGPDPKMLEVQIKAGELQLKQQRLQADLQQERITLQMDLFETQAKIADLQASASLKLSQSKGAEVDPQIKLLYAEIESQGNKRQHILDLLDIITRNLGAKDGESKRSGNGALEAPGTNAAIAGAFAPVGVGNPGGMAQ